MTKYISTTIENIEQLDKKYAIENKRPCANIKNHLSKNEEVISCYYAISDHFKGILFKKYLDIEIYILTDTKIISAIYLGSYIDKIELHKIIDVRPLTKGLFNKGEGVEISCFLNSYTLTHNSYNNDGTIEKNTRKYQIFLENDDIALQSQIISDIQHAIGNINKPPHRVAKKYNDVNVNHQESITTQLEKLSKLHESGLLTDEEFKSAKAQVLAKK